jgi:hypothetical protein
MDFLGEWHQGSSVVDNKKIIFFLHGNLPLLCIFAFQGLIHNLRFFLKNYGGSSTSLMAIPYIVFGAFLFVHLVVVHSNLHLVVEQILQKVFNVDSSLSTSSTGLSFKNT